MSKTNVMGESKETLAEKLYEMIDDKCELFSIFTPEEFYDCFEEALEDYALVPKNGIID